MLRRRGALSTLAVIASRCVGRRTSGPAVACCCAACALLTQHMATLFKGSSSPLRGAKRRPMAWGVTMSSKEEDDDEDDDDDASDYPIAAMKVLGAPRPRMQVGGSSCMRGLECALLLKRVTHALPQSGSIQLLLTQYFAEGLGRPTSPAAAEAARAVAPLPSLGERSLRDGSRGCATSSSASSSGSPRRRQGGRARPSHTDGGGVARAPSSLPLPDAITEEVATAALGALHTLSAAPPWPAGGDNAAAPSPPMSPECLNAWPPRSGGGGGGGEEQGRSRARQSDQDSSSSSSQRRGGGQKAAP